MLLYTPLTFVYLAYGQVMEFVDTRGFHTIDDFDEGVGLATGKTPTNMYDIFSFSPVMSWRIFFFGGGLGLTAEGA